MPVPADLTIRPARAGDIPAVVALLAEDEIGHRPDRADPDLMPVYQAAFARILVSGATRLFVAESGGRVIGTYQMTLSPGLLDLGLVRAYVEAVQVAADARGNGIGAALMAHAEATARESGAGRIELGSNRARTAAHRFYERLGFRHSHAGFKLRL